MPTLQTLGLFILAAVVLAAMPGPGLLYVAGRTLASGRSIGLASCIGMALGGAVHVLAGMIGVSALVMASATAFAVLKFCGGLYLLVLAVQAWRSAEETHANAITAPPRAKLGGAFREALLVEATNPKTAAFFLALIPQFIDAGRGHIALQFGVLGSVSVMLNTAMDVVAVHMAASLRDRLSARRGLLRKLRRLSACLLGGLGVSVLLTRRPA
jgi:threonine/homoserine/homoserine lactone efflux protein